MLVSLVVIHLLDPVTHQSYITTGGQIIIALITVGGTALGAQSYVIGKRAKKAVDQTRSTGNGYAKDTKAALARIEDLVKEQRADLRTLTNRFNNHIDNKEN